MAKKKDNLAQQLIVAIEEAGGDTLQKIQEMEQQAQRKEQKAEFLKHQLAEKRAEFRKVKEEAGKALANGEDPTPWLDQASKIDSHLTYLNEFLPSSSNADPAAEERQEIKHLKEELAQKVRPALNQSQALADATAEFNALATKLKAIHDDWVAALEEAEDFFQLPGEAKAERQVTLTPKLNDRDVARWITFTLAKQNDPAYIRPATKSSA